MYGWVAILAAIAGVAALFGYGGISPASVRAARLLAIAFSVLAVAAAAIGLARRRK